MTPEERIQAATAALDILRRKRIATTTLDALEAELSTLLILDPAFRRDVIASCERVIARNS